MRQVNILVASNSFKESLSSEEANNAIEKGFKLYEPLIGIKFVIKKKQICDGGTGFSSVLATSLKGTIVQCDSVDPLLRPITSHYGLGREKKKCFIEVAQTAGLALLSKEERNPVGTSSYGVGLQIKHAIEHYEPTEIYIGCGDTAVNDYGVGMLNALGVDFLSEDGVRIDVRFPKDFLSVKEISTKRSESLNYLKERCKVYVCGNLSSIIGGKDGTANVYARQKGATDSDIELLNLVKQRFIDLTKSIFKEDISYLPGCGGGGGVGGAAYLFLGAKLTYSFEKIFEIIDLESDIRWSNLVLTGEGLLDLNSLKGKAPIAVSLYSKKHNRQVGFIAGAIGDDCTNVLIRTGVDYVEPLSSNIISVENYIKEAKKLVTQASFRLASKLYG